LLGDDVVSWWQKVENLIVNLNLFWGL